MIRTTFAALAIVAAVPAASAATDLPPLAQNERVEREFLAVAVGDEIRQNCPTISARMIQVMSKAFELERYAKSLGYSDADIRAMRKDPVNKARLEGLRDSYLAANGVVAGDAESYCRLGRQEIADRTLIGSLIRSR
jgi:hypothetical protein